MVLYNKPEINEFFKYNDMLILTIERTTWEQIVSNFFNYNKITFLNKLNAILNNFRQENYYYQNDRITMNNKITTNEIKYLAYLIWNDFSKFNDAFSNIEKSSLKIFKEFDYNKVLYQDEKELIIGNPSGKKNIDETKKIFKNYYQIIQK